MPVARNLAAPIGTIEQQLQVLHRRQRRIRKHMYSRRRVNDRIAEASAAREEELLEGYFAGTPPSASERGRYVIYKAMCDLLWTLWGLLQHKNGNPVEDFWAYSLERFERCKKLMATPDFGAHVQAVARGAK